MDDRELAFTSALDQARLVRTGEVSPVELVECYLRRIEALNPRLNAYLTVAGEQALEAARRAAEARGPDLPPFHGVPISIKDLIDTAGIRTTRGTRVEAERVPTADAEVVKRVKQAGFIVLGKTNTPEFGMQAVTEPPGYPWAHNPWDPERTPGGSSGGAGAALAAGLCPIAVGSDGGGSIRIPSSFCGVFGIKTTRGRVSFAPLPNHLFAVTGPMARTVADAAALLDAIAGYATGDAWWLPPPASPFAAEAGLPPGSLRIGATAQPFIDGVVLDGPPQSGLQEAAGLLESLGHSVESAAPAWDSAITYMAAPAYGADMAASPELPPLDTLHPQTRQIVELGRSADGPAVMGGLAAIFRLARRTLAFWDTYDVLLTPTVAITAPRVGEFQDPTNSAGVFRYIALAAFTSPFNMTGQPAVNVPMGPDEDGMPRGVQLVGRPGDEATLIRLAAQMEAAHPWAGRRPPVS
jgi:amidase